MHSSWLDAWWRPPALGPLERIQHRALLLLLGVLVVATPVFVVVALLERQALPAALSGSGWLFNLTSLALLRAGRRRLAASMVLAELWVMALLLGMLGHGLMGNAGLYLPALPVMAGVLLGLRGAVAGTALSGATIALLASANAYGYNAIPVELTDSELRYRVMDLSLVIVLCGLSMGALMWLQQLAHAALQRENQERRRAEAEARVAQQTQARFLATMSHEIRTPINGIVGAARLLAAAPTRPEQREMISVVHDSADQLLLLVDDVLDYAQMDSGQLALEDEPVDLDRLCASIREEVQPDAARKGLRLVVQRAPELPAQLRTDAARLRQVVLHLVGNAIKFTPEGEGTVSLTLRSDGAQRWQIVVADTGIGIAPAQQATLFEPFSQADSSTTRAHGGTGLGLAIVRQIVARMGGSISVAAAPGEGATFTVSLPKRLAQPDAALHAAGGPGRLRVLVVDDHPLNRTLAARLLGADGHSVDTADDGAEALRAVRGGGWDLVLMDCQMPVMDGYTATRQIRALPAPARDTLVIGLSANALRGDRELALQAGMDDYLTKPFRPDRLYEMLRARAVTGTGSCARAQGGR